MAGWIRRLGSGRWQACYRDPSHRVRTKTFRRKADAERYLTATGADLLRSVWTDPSLGRETLGSYWERWLSRAQEAGKPTERTLIAYAELWRLYIGPALGRRPVAAITRADCRAVVEAAAERSPWRGNDTLKVLRRLLNAALDEELIGRNPAARIQGPAIHQEEPWVLTPEEVDRLADEVGERWRAFVLLAAYSSLRWSELVGLRVHRLDLLHRRIRVEEKIGEHGRLMPGEPKTRQSRRAVSIPEFVAFELAEHLCKYPPGADSLVFIAPEGGPVRRPHFGRLVWRPATSRAGLKGFPFKNLRHTGASLAIAAGANPLLVAARLGHTSTRMVEKHYVSLFEGLDREIGDKLGTMREGRKEQSQRLRPSG
jgi:integrase